MGKCDRFFSGYNPKSIDEMMRKGINSIFAESLADIYITCSNSTLLSTELATLLSVRYVEIPVFTLSYKEYLEFSKTLNTVNTLWKYIKYGEFPAISLTGYHEEITYKIIKDIYSTIILQYSEILSRGTI